MTGGEEIRDGDLVVITEMFRIPLDREWSTIEPGAIKPVGSRTAGKQENRHYGEERFSHAASHDLFCTRKAAPTLSVPPLPTLPRPRALLFDMDGTLTEPMLDFARIKSEMGIGDQAILEAMANDGCPPVDAIANAFSVATRNMPPTIPS